MISLSFWSLTTLCPHSVSLSVEESSQDIVQIFTFCVTLKKVIEIDFSVLSFGLTDHCVFSLSVFEAVHIDAGAEAEATCMAEERGHTGVFG